MTLAWFDAQAGASGDMLLGALVDAGAPLDDLQAAVDALDVEPVRLEQSRVRRAGLAATKVDVVTSPSDVTRTWADVRRLLEAAPLADAVRTRALDVFARLARAEGAAHGVDADEVHFHEVGALDALADVVGSCAGLHALGVTSAAASAGEPSSTRSTLGTVASSRPPAPVPVAVIRIGGSGPHDETADASSAAPVGVHASCSTAPPRTGAPASASSAATAGTGTGSTPWAVRTLPLPTVTTDAAADVTPSACSPAQDPTTSASASSAPTSWKWTSSAGTPCAAPSARANRAKTSRARDRTASSSGAASSRSRTSAHVRLASLGGVATSTLVAARPARVTRWAVSRTGSTPSASTAACIVARGAPASTSAPSSMSPLAPAWASNHASVTGAARGWPRPHGGRPARRRPRRRTRCRCCTPRPRARTS